jgi:hypothetical protein
VKNISLFICLCFSISSYSQGFTDVASELGLEFGYTSGEYGGGVSFADFNMDGMDDLTFATGNNQTLRFFQNNGNGFIELTFQIQMKLNKYFG